MAGGRLSLSSDSPSKLKCLFIYTVREVVVFTNQNKVRKQTKVTFVPISSALSLSSTVSSASAGRPGEALHLSWVGAGCRAL